MVTTGKVTGQSIATNLDGKNKVRILQVEITSSEDVQTIEAVYVGGEDNAPVIDSIVYILEVSSSFKIVIGVNDGIEPTIDAGERKVYSSDSGTIKAYTHYKASGNQEINGSGDYAVKYNELKTAFDTLTSDMNTFLSLYNGHIHVVPSGSSSPTVSLATPSIADMTTSKVDSVELPK